MQRGTLSFRITVLLVASFVALQFAVIALTSMPGRESHSGNIALPTVAQTRAMIELIEAVPPARRPAIASAFDGALYHVVVENGPLPPSVESIQGMDIGRSYSAALRGRVLSVTGQAARVPMLARINPWAGWLRDPLALHIALSSGDPNVLTIESQPSEPVRVVLRQRATLLGLGGLVALIALSLAVRATTRPIARLAREIRTFAGRPDTPDLAVSGSRELRDLAEAYNEMKGRIAELMAERTRVLAAIAHDMRTYLTRLRLRADYIGDDDQRDRAVHDLDEMSALLDDTLLLARADGPASSDMRDVDLSAEIARMAAIYRELGKDVRARSVPDGACVLASPLALRRVFANLIDNGLRHGTAVTLSLSAARDGWSIEIVDDGPGVPADALVRLGQPFGRLEPSRDRSTGGAGLGLAIVRALVAAHGGEVSFGNRQPSGLVAAIWFPASRGEGRAAGPA